MSLLNLGGSSSSTTKKTEVTNDQDTQTVGQGGVALEGGGNINIERTDYGAVQGGVDLGKAGLDFAEGMGGRALRSLDETTEQAFEFADRSARRSVESVSEAGLKGQDNIAQAYKQANQNEVTEQQKMLVIGATVLVAVAGIFMLSQQG